MSRPPRIHRYPEWGSTTNKGGSFGSVGAQFCPMGMGKRKLGAAARAAAAADPQWGMAVAHAELLAEATEIADRALADASLLRETLRASTQTIDRLLLLAVPSLADEAEAQFQHVCSVLRKRPIEETGRLLTESQCLQGEMDFLWEFAPKLMCHKLMLITNPSNARVLNGSNTLSSRRLERSMELAVHVQIALRIHCYSHKTRTLLMSARTLCFSYLHTSSTAMGSLQREKLVYANSYINKIRKQLADFIPRTPYTPSSLLILLNTDNLDIYSRKAHTRLKEGERVKSALLHALVTERIFYNPIVLQGPAPTGSLREQTPTDDFRLSVVPKSAETHQWLSGLWNKHTAKVQVDPMSPMERPDPLLDQ
jgi:hypothetical protein